MAMTGTATVTALSGPGNQLTAQALTGVTEVKFDLRSETIFIKCDQGDLEFELSDISALSQVVVEGVSVAFTMTNA